MPRDQRPWRLASVASRIDHLGRQEVRDNFASTRPGAIAVPRQTLGLFRCVAVDDVAIIRTGDVVA